MWSIFFVIVLLDFDLAMKEQAESGESPMNSNQEINQAAELPPDSNKTNEAKINVSVSETQRKNASKTVSKKEIYYSGFQTKRVEQIAAVKSILSIPDYSKQYKLVKIVLEKLFMVLGKAKLQLMLSTYIPGNEFPEDEKSLDALGNVLENVAFFGDILLRLPDITHQIYKKSKEWELLIHWGVSFCNETGIFDGVNAEMLNLVAQELNLIPKDPNYVNPYKLENRIQNKKVKEVKGKESDKAKAKRKTKKKTKKAKLSRIDL